MKNIHNILLPFYYCHRELKRIIAIQIVTLFLRYSNKKKISIPFYHHKEV